MKSYSRFLSNPEGIGRLIFNRLFVILFATGMVLLTVPVISYVLNLFGKHKEDSVSLPEFAIACFVIALILLIYDRVFLFFQQPRNPFCFSSSLGYLFRMPLTFIPKRESLPMHWRLAREGVGEYVYHLNIPSKARKEFLGDGDFTSGLGLILTLKKVPENENLWTARVDDLAPRPLWVLPSKFSVYWFHPIVVREIEEFMENLGLAQGLINFDGEPIDFKWNRRRSF